jgi:hypothetical protein
MKLATRLAVLVFLLLALPSVCTAQTDDGIAAIKALDGYVLVWNQPGCYFTLTIKGKDVQPAESSQNVLFKVDEMFFQVQAVAISQFMKETAKGKSEDTAILMAHRDWESDYIQNTLKKKFTVQTVVKKLKGGRDALLWRYDMPELPPDMHSTAKAQVYLSVVCGDHVILLNSTVEGLKTEAMAQALLLDTIATLKTSATPIDVQELRKTILGEKP